MSSPAAAAQAELESAGVNILHVPVERVSSAGEMFVGYRSTFCWAGRNQDNGSPWDAPKCALCERYYHTLEYSASLIDWDDPHSPMR